jgi:hypothetical protein
MSGAESTSCVWKEYDTQSRRSNLPIDLMSGIVRIVDSEGFSVGTGLLVSDGGLVATCAYVAQGAGTGAVAKTG